MIDANEYGESEIDYETEKAYKKMKTQNNNTRGKTTVLKGDTNKNHTRSRKEYIIELVCQQRLRKLTKIKLHQTRHCVHVQYLHQIYIFAYSAKNHQIE